MLDTRQYITVNPAAAAAATSIQSCPTLRDPIDGSPPGSPVLGILQARTLEWVAVSFSNAWKWKVKGKSFIRVPLFATPWTAAYQVPPSMGFSRQEFWSGVPLPSPIYRVKYFKSSSATVVLSPILPQFWFTIGNQFQLFDLFWYLHLSFHMKVKV